MEVALAGASYSQATLNITDGTVAGAGEPEETSFFLLATSNPGEFSAIFVPEANAGSKTLVVTSESEDREWKYDLSSFAFEGGKQYIYEIDRKNNGNMIFRLLRSKEESNTSMRLTERMRVSNSPAQSFHGHLVNRQT